MVRHFQLTISVKPVSCDTSDDLIATQWDISISGPDNFGMRDSVRGSSDTHASGATRSPSTSRPDVDVLHYTYCFSATKPSAEVLRDISQSETVKAFF